MRNVQWPVPRKRKGEALANLHVKVPQPFLSALREYARQESLRTGQKVSQGTILVTLTLGNDARLRRLNKVKQTTSST